MAGIQSATNEVIKDFAALANERDAEQLQFEKENAAYKRDVLAFKKSKLESKKSALQLQNDKLREKRAAFEKSLERKKHALNRVEKAKEVTDAKKADIEMLLAEARKKREARARING